MRVSTIAILHLTALYVALIVELIEGSKKKYFLLEEFMKWSFIYKRPFDVSILCVYTERMIIPSFHDAFYVKIAGNFEIVYLRCMNDNGYFIVYF